MKSKSTSQQQVTNTYAWQTPPETKQASAYDTWAQGAYGTPDPSIPYTFAGQRKTLNDSLNNPFGYNFSPEVSQAIKYSQNQDINQQQGQAIRTDRFNRESAKGQALAVGAGLNSPVLTQTGGSSQGSGTQTTPIGPAIINAVGQAGSTALG